MLGITPIFFVFAGFPNCHDPSESKRPGRESTYFSGPNCSKLSSFKTSQSHSQNQPLSPETGQAPGRQLRRPMDGGQAIAARSARHLGLKRPQGASRLESNRGPFGEKPLGIPPSRPRRPNADIPL